MRININSQQDLKNYISKIVSSAESNQQTKWVKYAKLGSKTIRLISYSNEFIKHIEKQLTYILQDSAESFDSTIVLWNETKPEALAEKFLENINPHRIRLEKLLTKKEILDIEIIDENYSITYPIIRIESNKGLVNTFDEKSNTYYYGVKDLTPEEFIKEGHVLVQIFNKITKTPTSALVHGACVGLNDEGILFCARGQRGKSTLSVLSMMKGFDYVSDDYLVLEKEAEKLYSYPIYSIITLSPRMYNELYDKLEGSRFLSNNARKDKYVVNIANYHKQFKSKYPIKFCMFPEIVSDKNPSIVPCPKGRSIVQLVQSSVFQLQDASNNAVINKLIAMVKNYEFYQINLCQDIDKNTECLREFMQNYDKREQKTFIEDKMYVDITFDLAHILNSEKGIIYAMNEFSTNIYENLVTGVSQNDILAELLAIENMPKTIEKDFNAFVDAMLEKEILNNLNSSNKQANIKKEFIQKCNYKISLDEFINGKTNNLIK
jgi:hypothetical protein